MWSGSRETPAEIPQSIRDMVRSRLRRLSAGCAETLAIAALIGERFDAAPAGVGGVADGRRDRRPARGGGAGGPDRGNRRRARLLAVLALADPAGDLRGAEQGPSGRAASADRRDARVPPRGRRRPNSRTTSARPPTRAPRRRRSGTATWPGRARCRRSRPRSRCVTSGGRSSCSIASAPRTRRSAASCCLTWRARTTGPGSTPSGTSGSPRRPTPPAASGAASCSRGRRSGTAASCRRRSAPTCGRRRSSKRRSSGWTSEDDGTRATILARLAHWLHNVRPYPERLELSDRSVAMARRSQDRRTLATVLLHRCWALDGPGDVGDALRVAGEILKIGAELGDPALTLEGLRIQLAAQFENGRHSAAVQTAHDMKTLAEEVRPPGVHPAGRDVGHRRRQPWRAGSGGRGAGRRARPPARPDRPFAGPAHLGRAERLVAAAAGARDGVHSAVRGAVGGGTRATSPGPPSRPGAWPRRAPGTGRPSCSAGRTPPRRRTRTRTTYGGPVIVGFSGAVDLVETGGGPRPCTISPLPTPGATARWGSRASSAPPTTGSGCSRGGGPLHRGHRAPGGRAGTAPRDGGPAVDGAHRGGLRPVLSMRGQAADVARAAALTESAMRTAEELGLAAITNRPRLRG